MQSKLITKRLETNKTKSEIAAYLGISVKQYSLKEKGDYCFTSDEMFKLAAFFDVEIPEIFLPR